MIILLIFIIFFSQSQDNWSYIPNFENGIVTISTITNPVYNPNGIVTTSITNSTRTYANVVHSQRAITGISSLQFIPTTLLRYMIQGISNSTSLSIIVRLSSPTQLISVKVSYLAFNPSLYFQTLTLNSYSVGGTNSGILVISWNTTKGYKQTPYPTGGSTSFYFYKCHSSILGFHGASTSTYEYSTDCQYKGNRSFQVARKLYNDTVGEYFFIQIVLYKITQIKIMKSLKIQLHEISFTSGSSNNVTPYYDPLITNILIMPSFMSIKVGVEFKYDFYDPANSFQISMSETNKVGFQLAFFSLRTCSNPLAYVNLTSYQCATQIIHTCSPQYFDMDTTYSQKINQVIISESNRYMAICFQDKVVIYKFNGVIYIQLQTIIILTNCKDIDSNKDFNILAFVGTNLFQVYTMSSNGKFQNFYVFPPQIGVNYSNSRISITQNGRKAVILTQFGQTVGHITFLYNRTLNEYIFQRFQPSNANEVYFNNDGSLLYVLTPSKLVIYQQKQPEKMLGNFIIKYAIITMDVSFGYICYSGRSALSHNQKVLAIYVQAAGIKIYHFDQITQKFVYHSVILQDYLGQYVWISLKISANGLQLIVFYTSIGMIFYYKRSNINDNFYYHSSKYSQNNDNGMSISLDGSIVTHLLSTTSIKILRVYICDFSSIKMIDPQNGRDFIYGSAQATDLIIRSNTKFNIQLDQQSKGQIQNIKQSQFKIQQTQKQTKLLINELKSNQNIIIGFIIVITIIIVAIKLQSHNHIIVNQKKQKIYKVKQILNKFLLFNKTIQNKFHNNIHQVLYRINKKINHQQISIRIICNKIIIIKEKDLKKSKIKNFHWIFNNLKIFYDMIQMMYEQKQQKFDFVHQK